MSTYQNNNKNNNNKNNNKKNNKINKTNNNMEDSNVERLDDSKISEAMAVLRFNVPDRLDERVNEALVAEERHSRQPGWGRINLPWFSLPAFAAALLVIVALLVFSPFSGTVNQKNSSETVPVVLASNQTVESNDISEIKTELVLSDSNIKIIWVQKKDFQIK